tara:strand:- start:352 stop:594 length:243 start_codon:yes stop_codon:yes gene_type:complete
MVRKEEFHQMWERFDRKYLHELMDMDLQQLIEHHVEVGNSFTDLSAAAKRAERYLNDVHRVMKIKKRLQVEKDAIEGTDV